MNIIELNGSWQGECLGTDRVKEFSFSATVPGCVHTDLAGVRIPKDIFYRNNADECQWIEERNWSFSRVFSVEESFTQAKLVFEGIDTYADIYLNGELAGSADNMFIPHSFDVAQKLRQGENTLKVVIRSPIKEVAGLARRDGAFTVERMHTRRMQCTYGWDWVARFVTCGIYKGVYLDFSQDFAVKSAYIYTEQIVGSSAQIAVEAEFENYMDGGFVDMEIAAPDSSVVYSHRWFCKEPFLKEYIDIPDAELWYPTGYGSQPLYTLRICGKEYPFGIRTAIIQQLSDKKGSDYHKKCLEIKDSISGRIYDKNEEFSGFVLYINSLPVMCKGANWVPCEPFASAQDDKKITVLLELAAQAGVNMLRVWGGGVFEKQHFYNECDRLGILVTQDFLMACGNYPEENPEFINQLRKETEYAAYSLRNHPSLVWWSGDNENAVWGNDEAENYVGRRAIHEGIMPVLMCLDPKRRFMRSSPCAGNTYASKTVGTTHNTQYLGDSVFPYILDTEMADYKEHFSTYLARFIAEEPTCGAISLPSLRRFMTDEDIFSSDEMWQYHTKSNPCLPFTLFDMQLEFSRKVLGEFADGADRYFKLKYMQFEWIRISMENIRRNKGFINGIVYWMWDDCWPASSGWAFVDYYCLPKASYYSFKRCASPLIVSIDKKDEYEIFLCNDGLDGRKAEISLSCIRAGQAVSIGRFEVEADAAKSVKVYSLPLSVTDEQTILVCDMESGGLHDRAFYKNGSLHLIESKAVCVLGQTRNSIEVTADEYVHTVELEGEFIFEDNYFSLLPGEKREVKFRACEGAQSEFISVKGYTVKS